MDFQEYVAARRTALVRAAVLLGAAEVAAPRIVHDTLLREADRIDRRADPDPVVHAALVDATSTESARLPEGDDPGLDVRRTLAAMAPGQRAVAVLAFHADLTPHETAEALGLNRRDVAELEGEARRTLGAADEVTARELLALAADTIELGPMPDPVVPAERPRWPIVAGVAAIACVLLVVASLGKESPAPDGPLADDQVPSLFGYDATSARKLLTGRGLEVVQRASPACEPEGLVVGSDPLLGMHVDAGDTVTIMTATPLGFSCHLTYTNRSDAWEFLAFAAGRGAAPRFAGLVAVLVDGSGPVFLGRDLAADPASWGDPSVLTTVADAIGQVYDVPGSAAYRTPSLDTSLARQPVRKCGVHRPPGTARREALSIQIYVRNVGPYLCPLTLDLYRTAGAIDTVALYTPKPVR
jgi:hypothetical protein